MKSNKSINKLIDDSEQGVGLGHNFMEKPSARGETRTHKPLKAKDFKSFVYTIPPPEHIFVKSDGGLGGNRTRV